MTQPTATLAFLGTLCVSRLMHRTVFRFFYVSLPGLITITRAMSFAVFNPAGSCKIDGLSNVEPMIESVMVGIWEYYDDFTSFLHYRVKKKNFIECKN